MKTMKKILSALLVVVMCLTSAPLGGLVGLGLPEWGWKASADYGIDMKYWYGYYFTFNEDGETVTLRGCTATSSELKIPMYISTYKVTGINTDDFYFGDPINKSVKKLVLPDTITDVKLVVPEIEEIELSDNTEIIYLSAPKVEKIVIPQSVKEIINLETKAEQIDIPEGAIKIGDWAFSGCSDLKKINLPDSITEIGKYAFYNCSNIKNLNITDNLNKLGEAAFYGCTNLKKISLSKNIVEIKQYTFCGCSNLSDIELKGKIKKIDSMAFGGTNLKKINFVADDLNIGEGAFMGCKSLVEFTYSGTIKYIGMSAFTGCMRLKSFDFGEKLEHIDDGAFSGCISLSSISLPDSVKKLGTYAFMQCFSLANIDVYSEKATIGQNAFPESSYTVDIKKYMTLYDEYEKLSYTTNDKMSEWVASKNGNYTSEEYEAQWNKLAKETGLYKIHKELNKCIVRDKKSKLLIRCYKGSTAEKYAKENGVKYKYFSNNPDEVTGFKASGVSSSAVALKWSKVSDATGYVIYQYNSSQKKYVKIGSTKDTSYKVSKLKSGTIYKFRIKAYKKVNGKNYYSEYTNLSVSTKPGTPTLKVTAGTGKATLTWNKQTGATGYVVYMSTSKNGSYSKIATVKGNTKVTYIKKGLKAGKGYYFKVRAYKTVGKTNVYSSYSNIKGVKIK